MARYNKHLVVLLGMLCTVSAQADIVVVVGTQAPVSSLSKEQVADIFLAKSATFPGGGPATPIEQTESAAPRQEFHSKVTGKSGAQLKAYWSKLVFTGKATAPQELADSAAVKQQVASNPALIGYIDKSAVDGSVKVVFTP